MNKYNVPKEEHKDIRKGITSGSSDGGELLYYYKWKDDADKYNEVMDIIGNMFRIKNIITQGYLFYSMQDNRTGNDIGNKELMRSSDAFCIFGEETPIFSGNHIVVPKGNIIDKINILSEAYPEDDYEIIQICIDYVNNSFYEITKEEYESMITYKPE